MNVRTTVVLALASAFVVAGGLHAFTQADAVVPVLVSLQRWTPFYWDQERYGMLVPLLAMPVRDPYLNLLVQRFLLTFAGLLAVLLLARHVLGRSGWRALGMVAAAALLLFAPPDWCFEYLFSQPYGLGLALALLGLAFAEPRPSPNHPAHGLPRILRLLVGLVLVLLAHWVNSAAGLLLLPLAFARAAVDLVEGEEGEEVKSRLAVDAALLVLGLAAAQLFGPRYASFQSAGAWPAGWAELSRVAFKEEWPWGVALLAVAALGAFVRRHEGRRLKASLLRAAGLAAAAVAYALLAGSLNWVRENAYHWRYIIPSAVLLHVAALSLLPQVRGALFLPPMAAVLAFGIPSPAGVRADLDRTCGGLTRSVLMAKCDAVAGDYWTVWPAVWHAEEAKRERGLAGHVYGLAFRAWPTLELWARPGARVCVPPGERKEADAAMRDHGLRSATEEDVGALRVLLLEGSPPLRAVASP